MKKICIFTSTRADYGLLRPLMLEIRKSKEFKLSLIVSGTHLSRFHGHTIDEIKKDGFFIDDFVEMTLTSDSRSSIVKSIAMCSLGINDALKKIKPDFLVILGDRFEAFAAGFTAYTIGVRIIHIHGGEKTEGALDEAYRHSLTKFSDIHFVATEDYRKRVIQLGENPEYVFNVGALGIDNIKKEKFLNIVDFENQTGIKFGKRNVLFTYHPVTKIKEDSQTILNNVFGVFLLKEFCDVNIIITMPNADPHNDEIRRKIIDFSNRYPERVFVFENLGQKKYLSAMNLVDVVIGNSSSGIIETPSFHIPTINIGNRQKGRFFAESIIDVDESKEEFYNALVNAFDKKFINKCKKIKNPYGVGNTSQKIINILKTFKNKKFIKEFYDIKELHFD
ncbi:MAG: UDP-N-acetylglucosamine 2-epimerase (hydrolyzing) [Candidatus Muiribacterium halophilum]|uniref:UDP-N-acetylglucosamine 2-epimerase (Hydrolyzing) n=1 Tax=Muiribacterium halophilum TaxID=2053465 RepID=A0A2N5ZA24_MUIH1|nr:MAG: UDP-N-acetylglucosamine 2-epimerase (hydrolyzing) [Candidatus Muirbacterium halophilum]